MSVEKKPESSEYKILDKLDEQQIKSADKQLKQALVYEIKGKKQITYIGLKWLTVKMAQGGQPLEIINSEISLDKDDPIKENKWHWRAKLTIRNQKTGLETEGVSECLYVDNDGHYDPFGRTKAHSKAERNAWRKQIPEIEIIEMLKTAKSEETQTVSDQKPPARGDPASKTCTCPTENVIVTPDEKGCSNCQKIISESKRVLLKELGKIKH